MCGMDSYIVRIVTLHDLLPYRRAHQGRTVTELWHELASRGIRVTRRMVQRDLNDWEEIFGLQCDRASGHHYWRRTRDTYLGRHFLVDDYYGDPVDLPGTAAAPNYGNSSRHPEWPHEPEQWIDLDRDSRGVKP